MSFSRDALLEIIIFFFFGAGSLGTETEVSTVRVSQPEVTLSSPPVSLGHSTKLTSHLNRKLRPTGSRSPYDNCPLPSLLNRYPR